MLPMATLPPAQQENSINMTPWSRGKFLFSISQTLHISSTALQHSPICDRCVLSFVYFQFLTSSHNYILSQVPFYFTTILFKMYFSKTIFLAAAALASMVVADNTAQFVNQDGTTRHIVFTPSEGSPSIAEITVQGNSNVNQQFPEGWTGNAYTYNEGEPNVPGLLAEFRFNGYGKANYFDVSSIVNPQATDGVMMIYPTQSKTPVSGCLTTPCSNQYNQPDDIATLSSTESDFTVLLGHRIKSARRGIPDVVGREYVLT